MAEAAAQFGHEELVRWLGQEQGFAMDKYVLEMAARSGNVELYIGDCCWSLKWCFFHLLRTYYIYVRSFRSLLLGLPHAVPPCRGYKSP